MSNLDAGLIQRSMTAASMAQLDELEVFGSIASTNTHLLSQPAPQAGRFRVALADHQTAGRGRRLRRWHSPPGAGLYLSVAYTFPDQPEQLPALTLAIGVGIANALRSLDIEGISLKWPNDLVALDGKLGGVLTEVQAGGGDGVTIVVGVGLNIDLSGGSNIGLESNWAHRAVDLKSVHAGHPDREIIAAALIGSIHVVMATFASQGFIVFAEEWGENDWLRGKQITVDRDDEQISGTAAGVDSDGALLVETTTGCTRVISGSILMAGQAESEQ